MRDAFANIESDIANATQAIFENIRLTDGYQAFGAVLDRDVEVMGEGGMTVERRMRITVLRGEYTTRFANGKVLEVDPQTYTVDEIRAMDRSSFILDRVDLEDGLTVSWWLK